MPCIHEDIICVTVSELERCGVKINTIKTNLKQHRQGLVYCWPHHKVGREVYIHYDGLKDKYKALIKHELCEGLEAKEWIKYNSVRNFLPPVVPAEKEKLARFVITREKINTINGEITVEQRTGLPDEYISLLLYQSRWYRLMHKDVYQFRKMELQRLNIVSLSEYRSICVMLANSPTNQFPEGAKLPKNPVACYRNQVTYEQNGILSLINGKYGNTMAKKVGDEQLQILIDLFSDPRKPDYLMTTKWYNDIVHQMGWTTKKGKPATISPTCVKRNLNIPEVMQVWYLARHGAKAWKNLFGYSILRFRPTIRDAVWCADGTKVNLYYATSAGITAKLSVYAIVDAYSGYWLGWDISEKENAQSVQRAMYMAIKRAGYILPFQMQYDGDSANSYYKRLTSLHFPAMPNNGQSKIIERAFKTLQEGFMRSADEFTGMNITATHLDSKVNEDYIEKLQKENRLKNKEEVVRMQEYFFHLMNNTLGADGKTPKQKYVESKNPNVEKVTSWEWINLFWEWNEQPIMYTKDGLIWTEDKIKKYYEVVENYTFDFINDTIPLKTTPDIDFICKYIRQEFWIRFDPENRGRIALYKEETDGSRRFVAWAIERERMPYAVQDYTDGSRVEIDKRLDLKKEQKRRAQLRREMAADFGDAEEILKLGHQWFDKEAMHQAETELYCTSVNSEIQEIKKENNLSRKEELKRRRALLSNNIKD